MARAIVESPLRFRIRKIFVLESFLNEEATEAMFAKRSIPA